jgi:benzoylformate decarboxylase
MEKAYSPAPVLPKPIPIIHLHIHAEEIARWFPVAVGLVGDERSGLEDLQQAVQARLGPKDRERAKARGGKAGEWVASHRQQIRERGRREWDEVPIRPWRVIQDIRSALGDEGVIVEECLSSAECLRAFYPTGTFFAENTQGYLGWGVSAAIGVQLALPKKRVVAFLGDGATMFGVQGLWTAAKYRVPVIYVVLKNRAYMVDRTLKQIERRNFLGTDLGNPDIDFALLAKSLGAEGERVERPQEIIPAAKRALARAGPTVIDCVVEEENARRLFQDIHWLPWLEAHASKGYTGGW